MIDVLISVRLVDLESRADYLLKGQRLEWNAVGRIELFGCTA